MIVEAWYNVSTILAHRAGPSLSQRAYAIAHAWSPHRSTLRLPIDHYRSYQQSRAGMRQTRDDSGSNSLCIDRAANTFQKAWLDGSISFDRYSMKEEEE